MPRSSGGGSHSGGYSSSSGSSRSSSGGGSHSSGYRSSSGSSYSGGGSYSSGYRSSSGSSYSSYRSTSSTSNRSGCRSSSSGNRSYSSAGSSRKTERPEVNVSKKAFPDARRYVYYRDNKPQYIYSNYETLKVPIKKGALIGWLIVLSLVLFGDYLTLFPPEKLATDYDHRIVIEDQLDLIDQEAGLRQAMEAFLDKTGITPAVMTIPNESWQTDYKDLQAKAFDLYVNTFEDEKHWLLVYSEPKSPASVFVDWYWEGIQGDETVGIITQNAADAFGMRLQKYLTATSRYTIGEAFAKAFSETTPELMHEWQGTTGELIFSGLFFLVLLTIALYHTGIARQWHMRPKEVPKDAVAVLKKDKEVSCGYCSGVYLSSSLKCPHCGAARTEPDNT